MGNVFDLTGPEFLEFYGVLIAVGLTGALFVRWFWRTPSGSPAQAPRLEPEEVAFLSGRRKGLAHAVIAGMVQRGTLEVDVGTRRICRCKWLGPPSNSVEVSIYESCSEKGTRVETFYDVVASDADLIERQLQSKELVVERGIGIGARALPFLIMVFVLAVGCIKIAVGISRHRPVGLLVFLCLLTIFLAMLFLIIPVWRTRRGDRVLRRLRSENPSLKTSAGTPGHKLDPRDVVLAFALFGPRVVGHSGELNKLRTILRPPTQGGGSGGGCGSAGCGGGGGGGGCGGCGGGGH